MKRILLLLFCFYSFQLLYAQQLSVQSFNWEDSDKTASSENTKMVDQNGKVCALIKVKTPIQGLSFDVGALGIAKTQQQKDEIWLYVPEGVKRITVSHQQYGVLRDYDLGQTLKRGNTYYLFLKKRSASIESLGSVDISSNPPMADIYIDGEKVGRTPNLITELEAGAHKYRISIPDYTEVVGELQIQKDKTQKLFANLSKAKSPVIIVDSVRFRMLYIEGGSFLMGATKEQLKPETNEKPAHQVTLSSYYIGEVEVTQKLWETVMGTNPSFAKNKNQPVNEVSWNDCQSFIEKLNKKTGLTFRLPTEAEWEYAARGGNKSQGYQYSGSNILSEVGWYRDNSDENGEVSEHKNNVKKLSPNELNIYDMSGGVWEWCQDIIGNYPSSSQSNPVGATIGNERVIRGGSWKSSMWSCRNAIRISELPDSHNSCLGLRLALQTFPKDYFVNDKGDIDLQDENYEAVVDDDSDDNGQEGTFGISSVDTICFKVGKVPFSMVYVDGGNYRIWDGEDFGSEDIRYIMKAIYGGNFDVSLSSYYIGETEVTYELWEAVMGSIPGGDDIKYKKFPVVRVSLSDCEDFIKKLSQITGKDFRLPTDAEWQVAAQGGKKSKGYRYSGSNDLDEVARTQAHTSYPVKTLKPNELGIYNMTGNVWEWCSDKFYYEANEKYYNIVRGGCYINNEDEHLIQLRGSDLPTKRSKMLGLRLALSK